MKLDAYLTPYTEINSKQIKDLTVRSETVKLLKENIREKIHDIGHETRYKGRNRQVRPHRLKSLCTEKETKKKP